MIGFDLFAFNYQVSNKDLAKDVRFSKNSVELDMCLERKDFETIIRDSNLFWLAYCKAIQPHQPKEDPVFFIAIERKEVIFSGKEDIIKQTQEMIEGLRKFFLEGLETKRTFEILVVKRLNDYHFRKESPAIDLSYTPNGYFENWYHNFIKPALPQLTELCGAIYIEDKKNQEVIICKGLSGNKEKVEVIRISWKEEFHLVYPISLKAIPEQEEMGKAQYSLYQKQLMCDFSLVSKSHAIKVHSSILYLQGGPVLQNLLTSNMKETTDKMILFTEYSQSTVEAFIEFIYLGGKAFSEKVVSSHNQNAINLFELFEFAHTYQIETLTNCCTNLISLIAKKQDLEVIQGLVKLYENKHLELLCEHLSIKRKLQFH